MVVQTIGGSRMASCRSAVMLKMSKKCIDDDFVIFVSVENIVADDR